SSYASTSPTRDMSRRCCTASDRSDLPAHDTPLPHSRTSFEEGLLMSNPATDIFTTRESEVRSYCRNWPVVFDTAKGPYQWSEDGDRYTDFFSGACALNYGHNNDILKEALVEYISNDGVTHSMDMYTRAKREFLETFT